jgi:uncharacterized protein (DUF58 family)
MLSAELQAFARRVELKTQRVLSGSISASYRTMRRGIGLEFEQLRDYQPGDDIRHVDWKSSARSGRMLVRQHFEEQNRLVLLVVDCSASVYYGSTSMLKIELLIELASIMALVAHYYTYSLGLVLLDTESNATQARMVMPALASREHSMHVIHTLVNLSDSYSRVRAGDNSGDVLSAGLIRVLGVYKKSALVCIFSDFLDTLDSTLLQTVAHKHEVLAFRCLDVGEYSIPEAVLYMQDSETGISGLYDTRDVLHKLNHWHDRQEQLLHRCGISCLTAVVGREYTAALARFLRYRI